MKLQSAARTADLKLIFVPLIYMLLRVWSVAVDVAIYYLPPDKRMDYRSSDVSAVLLFLVVSWSGRAFWWSCELWADALLIMS